MWKRFNIRWTPTVLILAPDGAEAYRIEGFLPRDEFLSRLHMGLGFMAVNQKRWQPAREEFESVVANFPNTDAAPEALYWAGVSKYSNSHDASELKALGKQFKERYTNTSWAKRASIW